MERQNIINKYFKNDFEQFLKDASSDLLLELFNSEGISILNDCPIKEERIDYILAFSKYKNELLKSNEFLDVLLNSSFSSFRANLATLDNDSYDNIINRAIEIKMPYDEMAKLLSYFNNEYQVKFFDMKNMPSGLLYGCLKRCYDEEKLNKLFLNNDIDLTNEEINLVEFFDRMKKITLNISKKRNNGEDVQDLNIKTNVLNEELALKIFNEFNIYQARRIINDASYSFDSSLLNDVVKNLEDQVINGFKESQNDIYSLYTKYIDLRIKYDYDDSVEEELYYCKKDILKLLNDKYQEINPSRLDEQDYMMSVLENIKSKTISDYIIDYHFEENYYNVILDIKELLNFYEEGNVSLDESHVEIYKLLKDLDTLSLNEKITLHNKLKNNNIMEMFYDDMSLSRRVVNEAIKDYSLSKETLKKYQNEELSKEYGIPVYSLEGENFFGVVKTVNGPGSNFIDNLPTGHSFSLVGNGGIAVFGNVKDSKTFLYDSNDINPDQIIHAYPFDSFTLYKPFEGSSEATERINHLAMPDELVNLSYSYNEILLMEEGKENIEFNKTVPKLKQIALYCIDEIRKQDIEVAKESNLGILLVNSSKYHQQENLSSYDYHANQDLWNFSYFDGVYNLSQHEAKR